MIVLTISFIFSFLVVIPSDFEETLKPLITTTIVLFCICTSCIFMVNKNTINEKTFQNFKEEIYSLNNGNNNVSGNFFLGSGSIDSKPSYTYFIKNKDGSKEKKQVTSNGTKIFEGEYEKPYLEEISCKNGSKYSLLLGYFEDVDVCEKQFERKLFVPNNTIILEFNLK